MDRKSFIVLVASFGLILLWFQMVHVIWPPKPKSLSNTNTVASTPTLTNVAPAEPLPSPTVASNEVTVVEPEKVLTVESEKAIYTLTSHGGGLRSIALKEYDAVVACRKRKAQGLASVNRGAPAPILSLVAPNLFRTDDPFELSQTNELQATRAYSNGLQVVKTFVPLSNYLVRATVSLENTTGETLLIPPHAVVVGTASPASEDGPSTYLGIYRDDGNKAEHVDARWFANRTLGCFPGTPKWLYQQGRTNTFWGAVHNQFFTAALVPDKPADQLMARPVPVPPWRPDLPLGMTNEVELAWQLTTNDIPNPGTFWRQLAGPTQPLSHYLLGQITAGTQQAAQADPASALPALVEELNGVLRQQNFYELNRSYFATLNLDPPVQQLIAAGPTGEYVVRLNRLLLEKAYPRQLGRSGTGYEAALTYETLSLAPGEAVVREYLLYAGPRKYNTLAKLGKQLGNDLDQVMGYSGFFGWFAKALLLSMNGLNSLGLGYAAAIIIITVIIKSLFWPLTNASTRSMKRMAALQPQMKALQERYKEDPAKMNRKLMEFMKEHKVSPLGGCLPMLLQLPVFFGFFTMIRSAIELRGASFLWVCDLSQPDTLFILPGFNVPFNLLPLLMGTTMLWQARLTPPSPGMDPAQQKIMRYMPLMFLVILYNFSAGLTLYWTVQNLLTIAQMKLTKAKAQSGPKPGAVPSASGRLQPKPRKPKRKP